MALRELPPQSTLCYSANDDEIFVLSTAPDFKLLRVNRLGESTLASPALVGSRWCFRTAAHLLCVGEN